MGIGRRSILSLFKSICDYYCRIQVLKRVKELQRRKFMSLEKAHILSIFSLHVYSSLKRSVIFNNKPSLFHYVSFTIFFFFFLSFVSLFSPFTSNTSCLGIRCPLSEKADNFYFQEFEKTRSGYDEQMEVSSSMARRFLSGPGSSPPRCTSKCGNCTPCEPVHVAMPPGTPVTTEYYPEAWRCKCGNKLYMP